MRVHEFVPVQSKKCVSDNEVQEFRNACRKYENVGLMM